MSQQMSEIDFVITWVDGNDPQWQSEKRQYEAKSDMLEEGVDNRTERYRDWELLTYWFRGVEKYAPWVRKIHFVTWGHIPVWLNQEHPKLHIVPHEDIIPKEYLPVFNCNVIEMYLHQIEGLSEQFVYFNDDIFLIRKLSPKYFFQDQVPCDMLAFQPIVANPENPVMSHLYINNMLVLSKYFDKRTNVRQQPGKYFHLGYPPLYFFYNLLELSFPRYTGLYTVHGAFPYCRRTFEEIWQREEELLREVSTHRFRCKEDVSSYLFREWQKLTGHFRPKNILRNFRYFNLGNENKKLLRTLEKQKAALVCLNDADLDISFPKVKHELQEAFEKLLKDKSSFEV